MTQLITVTFDGKVFTPKTALNLEIDKEYQIQLVSNLDNSNIPNTIAEKENPIRNHQSFLNGYAPEDEGLYDDY